MNRRALVLSLLVALGLALAWGLKPTPTRPIPAPATAAAPAVRMTPERAIDILRLPVYATTPELRVEKQAIAYNVPSRNEAIHFDTNGPAVTFGGATMTAMGAWAAARTVEGRVIYDGVDSALVYAPSPTGMREDLVLYSKPAGSTFAWSLQMPDTMEARLLGDGSIGLFTASEDPYSGVTVCDHRSAELVAVGRAKADKNRLSYRMPPPFVLDANGRSAPAYYTLDRNLIAITAEKLETLTYPVTIDPPIIITSTADFVAGNNEGGTSFGTSGQVRRARPGGGDFGTWTNDVNQFQFGREGHVSLVYGGFLYVIGGFENSTGSYLADVEVAPISAAGGLTGPFVQTNSFVGARRDFGAVAYNGFLYVFGGYDGVDLLSDVQFAPINSDGTIGAFTATTPLPTKRRSFAYVATRGYLYALSGESSGGVINESIYMPVRPNGTLFAAWGNTSPGPFVKSARAIAHGAFIYLTGGNDGTFDLSTTSFTHASGDGTLDGWIGGTTMTFSRSGHALGVIGGFLVAVSGNFTQYAESATIGAGGELGEWRTDNGFFPAARSNVGGAVYENTFYLTGGFDFTSGSKEVFWSVMDRYGTKSQNNISGAGSPTSRWAHAAVAWNGYLYVLGGHTDAAGLFYTNSTAYGAINPATGQVLSWTVGTNLPDGRAFLGAAVYDGRLYIVGGRTLLNSAEATVYYTPLNELTGALGVWSATTSMVFGRRAHGCVAIGGRLYAIGGIVPAGSETPTSHFATINGNGTIAAWEFTSISMGTATSHMAVATNGNRIYIVGGQSAGAVLNSVRMTLADTTPGAGGGALGTWSTLTVLPEARTSMFAFVSNDVLYAGTGRLLATDTSGQQGMFYARINAIGTLSAWTTAIYPYVGIEKKAICRDGIMYVLSGIESGPSSYTDTFRITGLGTVSQWTTDNSLPSGRYMARGAGFGDYVYVTGGSPGLTDVVYQKVDFRGRATGAWLSTTPMPAPAYYHAVAAANARLYVAGGIGNDTGVHFAPINPNGTLGLWTTTTPLPVPFSSHTMGVWNNRLYVYGGGSSVYFAPINLDGTVGSWTATTSMLQFRTELGGGVSSGFLYAIGGQTGTGVTATVEFASINADGTVGAWSYTSPLPQATYFNSCWAQDGFLYNIGGYNPNLGGEYAQVYAAPLSSNGLVGGWVETESLPGEVYAAGAFGHRGRLFLIGGYKGGALASVYSAALLTPAQAGLYTRRIEFNNDKELTSITISGSATSKGYVFAKLAGSTNAANNFGQYSQNIFPVSLGTPFPLGSALVRWLYVAFALDDTFSAAWNNDSIIERDVTDITVVYNTRPTAPTGLTQLENGATLVIPPGGGANDGALATTTVAFQVSTSDEDGDTTQLRVEAVPVLVSFTNTSTCTSAFDTLTTKTASFGAFTPGAVYRWQAWVVDSIGATTSFVPFGGFFFDLFITDFYIDRAPGDPVPDQFEADGATPIPVGNNAASSVVVFGSAVNDLDAPNTLTLQIEVQNLATAFTGTVTNSVAGWAPGQNALVSVDYDPAGINIDFHWRARVMDNEGVVSNWVAFGGNGDAPPAAKDFRPIQASPPTLANIVQRNASDLSVIISGGETNGTAVEISADIADLDVTSQAKIQIEVRLVGDPFTSPTVTTFAADGVIFFTTAFTAVPTTHSILIPALAENGRYQWQIRAVDDTPGFNLSTPWTGFGGNVSNPPQSPADTDFYVDQLNDMPIVVAAQQYQSDGVTVLASGASSPGVVVRARINDVNFGNTDFTPSADCRLQVEFREISDPFQSPASATFAVDNVNFFESAITKGDNTFLFTVPTPAFTGVPGALTNQYVWQVRAIDTLASVGQLASAWAGPGGAPDFFIVPNGAPADPSAMDQVEAITALSIPAGFTIATADVNLVATLTDPLGQPCRLQVEFRPMGQSFTSPLTVTADAITFFETAFAPSASPHTLPFVALAQAGYHWQIRCMNFGTDGTNGIASNWVEFGGNPTAAPDFRIETINDPPTLPTGLTQLTPPDNRPVLTGGHVVGRTIILRAESRDPEAGLVAIDFELQPVGVPLAGTATQSGPLKPPGEVTTITINDLNLGSYHWAVRARDSSDLASAWVEFGGNPTGQGDFLIDATTAISPNSPVAPSQWLANNSAVIPTGNTVNVSSLRLKATVTHPRGEAVKLQVELQPVGAAFTNVANYESAFVSTGTIADILVFGLQNGFYRWQCRTVDTRGGSSAWVSYGGNPETTPPDDLSTGVDESDPAVSPQANDFVIDTGTPVRPDLPILIGQYRDNGVTPIPVGGAVNTGTVTFRAFVTDPNGNSIRLEVEVRPLGVAFTGTSSGVSDFVPNGSEVSVTISGLPDAPYKWRALAADATGATSFVDYGGNTDTDADFLVLPSSNTAPNAPTGLDQLKLDGITSIPVSGITSILGLNFSGLQTDVDNDLVRLEVEVRPTGDAFNNAPTAVGDLSISGFNGQLSMTGFTDGQTFHWQLRVVDSTGNQSPWAAFGGNADPGDLDFMTTTNGGTESNSSTRKKCGLLGLELLIVLAFLRRRRA